MSYLPHEQRVLDELQELTTRLVALHMFTNTPLFLDLDPIDRILLLKQYQHMHKYAKVLQDRVDRFVLQPGGEGTRTISPAEQLLRIELQELVKRINTFHVTNTPVVFSVLPMNEQDLLHYQHQYMRDYARILRERIALFTNRTNGG